MRMGLREANQRVSRAVKAVKAGREVVLTERGRPITVIKPAYFARAEALAGATPVKTLDAVHLASALVFQPETSLLMLGLDVVFVG